MQGGLLLLLTACAAGTMQCFAASCTGRAGSTHTGLTASAGFRACTCAQLASLGLRPAILPMLAAAGTAQNAMLGCPCLQGSMAKLVLRAERRGTAPGAPLSTLQGSRVQGAFGASAEISY